MACFADINVSQGSVATYARCGEIFNMHLTASLPGNLSVKKSLKSVKIWQNYGHESVVPFLPHPVKRNRYQEQAQTFRLETETETETRLCRKVIAKCTKWPRTLQGIEHFSDSRLFFGATNDECMSVIVQRTALFGGIGPVQIASHHFVAAGHRLNVCKVIRTFCS